MRLLRLTTAILGVLLASQVWAGSETSIGYTAGAGTNVAGFTAFSNQFIPGHAIMNSAGTELATGSNPVRVDPTGTTPQPVTVGTVVTNPSGGPVLGAVTTNPPNYANATNQPSSIDTAGNTRVIMPLTNFLTSGTTAAGTDPGQGIATLCINGSPTLSAGQAVALQCATNGALLTTAGTVAQGSTTSGQNGILMQGTYLTSPPTYSNATTNPFTTDIHGNMNVNVAAGSAANAAASATGAGVPNQAGYTGLNVGGNNTGWTGTSVSAIRAGDLNLALLNGAVPLVGSGTETGVLRVTLPTNGTGTVGISSSANGVSGAVSTGNGWTPLRLAGLTNTATSIKASAGQLGMLYCANTNNAWVYAQLFNTASGGVTVGSTANVGPIGIPPNSNGGFPLSFPGVQFSTAISIAVTTTAVGGTAPGIAVDCAADFT